VLRAVGQVLAAHPDANRAYRGGPFPRLATHQHVDAKLTLDKPGTGERNVLSVVLPAVDSATLDDIQDTVNRLRADAPADIPELRGALALQRLPMPLGWLAFRLATRLRHRHRRLGTVAVTSLGHRPVIRFFSNGGTAITVGIGRIRDLPVVRDGAVVVAPSLPLSLTFDHRVLDGALAADVLTDLKRTLETYDASRPAPIRLPDGVERPGAVARAGAGHHAG
jgi:pyruvate/2-oxoglutarate dehydrogenase complex dihydrolipoamide acyltransferase (E2) component